MRHDELKFIIINNNNKRSVPSASSVSAEYFVAANHAHATKRKTARQKNYARVNFMSVRSHSCTCERSRKIAQIAIVHLPFINRSTELMWRRRRTRKKKKMEKMKKRRKRTNVHSTAVCVGIRYCHAAVVRTNFSCTCLFAIVPAIPIRAGNNTHTQTVWWQVWNEIK